MLINVVVFKISVSFLQILFGWSTHQNQWRFGVVSAKFRNLDLGHLIATPVVYILSYLRMNYISVLKLLSFRYLRAFFKVFKFPLKLVWQKSWLASKASLSTLVSIKEFRNLTQTIPVDQKAKLPQQIKIS